MSRTTQSLTHFSLFPHSVLRERLVLLGKAFDGEEDLLRRDQRLLNEYKSQDFIRVNGRVVRAVQ